MVIHPVYPLKNIEAQTIADVLVEQCFSKFNVLEIIDSDQGIHYERRHFKDTYDLLGISLTRTTAFYAKSDGMVERL